MPSCVQKSWWIVTSSTQVIVQQWSILSQFGLCMTDPYEIQLTDLEVEGLLSLSSCPATLFGKRFLVPIYCGASVVLTFVQISFLSALFLPFKPSGVEREVSLRLLSSDLSASSIMSFSPFIFFILTCLMAILISPVVFAVSMFCWFNAPSVFKSFSKCPIYLSICFWISVIGLPCLSLTVISGFLDCHSSFLVVSYVCLIFPSLAVFTMSFLALPLSKRIEYTFRKSSRCITKQDLTKNTEGKRKTEVPRAYCIKTWKQISKELITTGKNSQGFSRTDLHGGHWLAAYAPPRVVTGESKYVSFC